MIGGGRPAAVIGGMEPAPTVNAWDLFLRTFKPGQEIVLITEDDRWFWGILHGWTQDACILRRPHMRNVTKEIRWENVAFMCHDGFPVSRLKGADGSASIDLEMDIRCGLREVFAKLKEIKLKELVIGDPHLIEGPVSAVLYNQGNEGWDHYDQDDEEVLSLVSEDGAHAHLWQLDRVYHGSEA